LINSRRYNVYYYCVFNELTYRLETHREIFITQSGRSHYEKKENHVMSDFSDHLMNLRLISRQVVKNRLTFREMGRTFRE